MEKETTNLEQRFVELSWNEAVDHLKQSRFLAYPTDTLWGLGCRADNAELCYQCLDLKGENRSRVASCVMPQELISNYVELPSNWNQLLPGPYTLVLPLKTKQLEHIASPDGFLGCRIPGHDMLNKMVSKLGVPLVTTSLNQTGQAPLPALGFPEVTPYGAGASSVYIAHSGFFGQPFNPEFFNKIDFHAVSV